MIHVTIKESREEFLFESLNQVGRFFRFDSSSLYKKARMHAIFTHWAMFLNITLIIKIEEEE